MADKSDKDKTGGGKSSSSITRLTMQPSSTPTTTRRSSTTEGTSDLKTLLNAYFARSEASMQAHVNDLKSSIQNTITEVKTELSDKIDGLQTELTSIREDVKKLSVRQDEVEKRAAKAEQESKSANKNALKMDVRFNAMEGFQAEIDEKVAMNELQIKASWLRIRGLPENSEGRDLKAFMKQLLKEVLQETDPNVVEGMLVATYRLNSAFARNTNVPRDCIIQFGSQLMRDLVLQEHFKNPILVGGVTLILMKEIPVKLLRKRKNFSFLVEKLKRKGIRFSWLFPQGLSFHYNTRQIIRSEDSARIFLRRYKKEFGEEEEEEETLSSAPPKDQRKKTKKAKLKGAKVDGAEEEDTRPDSQEEQEEGGAAGGVG